MPSTKKYPLGIPTLPQAELKDAGSFNADGGQPTIFSITAKSSEMQSKNGLKYQDYRRYRVYCKINLKHCRTTLYGKQKRRQHHAKPQERSQYARYLKMLLLLTERAWSYGYELKLEAANFHSDKPRIRRHALRRFRKALIHARRLEETCESISDRRTFIDAQAYSSWINALVLLEEEKWKEATDSLMKARMLFTQLKRLFSGSIREEIAFQAKLEELDPHLRLCQYHLGVHLDDIGEKANEGLAEEAIQDVIEENVPRSKGLSNGEFMCRGQLIIAPTENLRLSFTLCHQKIEESCISTQVYLDENLKITDFVETYVGDSNSILSLYDNISILVNESVNNLQSGILENSEVQLNTNWEPFQRYGIDLQRLVSIERTALLVLSFLNNIKFDGSFQNLRSEEALRFCDLLLQDLEILLQNTSVEEKPSIMGLLKDFVFIVNICRATCLSLLYASLEKNSEAYGLVEWVLRKEKAEKFATLQPWDLMYRLTGSFFRLQEFVFCQSRRLKCAYLHRLIQDLKPDVREMFTSTPVTFYDSLKNLKLSSGLTFPPSYEIIRCKPLLIDLAVSAYQPPDIIHRTKQEYSGIMDRLKSWWR